MLFHRFELRAALEELDNKLTRSVEAVSASEILSRSPDHLAAELCHAFRINPPVLRESGIQASQEETQVDVSQDPRRFISDRSVPFHLPGTTVSFHVPFDGDPELFGARPSSFTLSPPHADVGDGELVFSFERLDHDARAVKGEFERDLAAVRQNLSWIQNDVAPFNEALQEKAKQRIERRRERLLKDQGMVSQLGYPLRRRENAPRTYATLHRARRDRCRPASPLIGRRVPQVVQVAVGDAGQAFEPAVVEQRVGAGTRACVWLARTTCRGARRPRRVARCRCSCSGAETAAAGRRDDPRPRPWSGVGSGAG